MCEAKYPASSHRALSMLFAKQTNSPNWQTHTFYSVHVSADWARDSGSRHVPDGSERQDRKCLQTGKEEVGSKEAGRFPAANLGPETSSPFLCGSETDTHLYLLLYSSWMRLNSCCLYMDTLTTTTHSLFPHVKPTYSTLTKQSYKKTEYAHWWFQLQVIQDTQCDRKHES